MLIPSDTNHTWSLMPCHVHSAGLWEQQGRDRCHDFRLSVSNHLSLSISYGSQAIGPQNGWFITCQTWSILNDLGGTPLVRNHHYMCTFNHLSKHVDVVNCMSTRKCVWMSVDSICWCACVFRISYTNSCMFVSPSVIYLIPSLRTLCNNPSQCHRKIDACVQTEQNMIHHHTMQHKGPHI